MYQEIISELGCGIMEAFEINSKNNEGNDEQCMLRMEKNGQHIRNNQTMRKTWENASPIAYN